MGRTWFSPAGAGLYMSIVLRPDADPQSLLTLASGVALLEGVRASTGLLCELKWPNDLLVNKRKLAGILAEGTAQSGRILYIVLGIGLNLRTAAYPPELADRVTSIEGELGRPVDRALIIAEVLAALNRRLADLHERKFDAILSAWREGAAALRGAVVEWDSRRGTRRGRVHDIDDTGALIVHDGVHMERLVAGEVRWV
jgi:BirA family biotin operon repressor/biotin-[acetyl-CoA-carboxylase] ligase